MQYVVSFFTILLLAASTGLAAGHGAITSATGNAGGHGTALGSKSSLSLSSVMAASNLT